LWPRITKEACALAVRAGVNIELPEPDCYLHLVELVRKGVLKESQLDELVAPMLFWKFKLGLFDDPYVDPDEAERVVGCENNRKLALQAARETITLLKNENNLVPLNPAQNQIHRGHRAERGPRAARRLQRRAHKFSPCSEGIRAKVGDRVQVPFAEGCKITVGGSWNQDLVTPAIRRRPRQIAEAVKVAQQADVIVLAIGGNEQTSREAWSLKHMGDRTRLDLVGRQEELVTAMLATGKPVIVLLFNGSPLSINT
jgi:beta-glucosidase